MLLSSLNGVWPVLSTKLIALMTRKGDRFPLSPRGAWPWRCPQGQRRDRRLINNIAESVFSVECGLLWSRPTRPQQNHAEVTEEASGAWEALQSVFQELSSAIFYMKAAGNHSK